MATRVTPSKGGKPDKLIRAAIILALHRETEDDAGKKTKRLRQIANALVAKAASGDVPAIKEVADRVDGKAIQPLQHDVGTNLEELLDRIVAIEEP